MDMECWGSDSYFHEEGDTEEHTIFVGSRLDGRRQWEPLN